MTTDSIIQYLDILKSAFSERASSAEIFQSDEDPVLLCTVTSPFDENDDSGNDSGNSNKIVRTFDTVTYRFTVEMESYTSTGYSEARVKLEFVLPINKDEAIFDQTAMAWMDQTSGYAPKLTTETRSINGVDTECQVLTCYKRLLPSEGNSSVVPGSFGENVTVNVKSMNFKRRYGIRCVGRSLFNPRRQAGKVHRASG